MRKILFWSHLSVGVAAGLVVLMMSVTGVLLTYERQIVAWAASRVDIIQPAGTDAPLTPEALLAELAEQQPEFTPTSLTWRNGPGFPPVTASAGRSGSYLLDPWTGTIIDDPAQRFDAFFSAVTAWHRWFNVSGDGRDTARAVTGASNLGFLFLVLSGIYLWLPPVYRWLAFRTRLFFNPRVDNAKARDYNWHHVFGFWCAIPLAVVVATALVFSYGWANNLVYRAFGEEPPTRSASGPAPAPVATPERDSAHPVVRLPIADHLDRLRQLDTDWTSMSLQVPAAKDSTLSVTVDTGTGGQPQTRYELTVDAASGNVVEKRDFSDNTPARQARLFIRFLHTGEALGVAGQTIAGVVSLLSVLMVWTGLALAWRRLISPLFRQRRLARASSN